MRAGVKYFVEQRGKKAVCAMYQDTDFGKDVLAGAQMQAEAMGMKIVATTAHKPTDTDFTAGGRQVARGELRPDNHGHDRA